MRIYGGLNSDAYSGVQQWIEVAGAQGLLSSIFFQYSQTCIKRSPFGNGLLTA